jgi:hypothetical protein
MKKVMLFLMLSVFALGSSGFKANNSAEIEPQQASCFEAARVFVIAVYGEINLSNVQLVLDINEACEEGRLEPR